jgi:hypothetical protein
VFSHFFIQAGARPYQRQPIGCSSAPGEGEHGNGACSPTEWVVVDSTVERDGTDRFIAHEL